MKLTLTLVTNDPRAAPSETVKVLEAGSLRIGRGRDNDWILPDPDRHISKNHCRVDVGDDGYMLIDSSTNGVFLNQNGGPVGRGNGAPLSDGDTFRLGTYEFEVRIEDASGHVFGKDDVGYGASPADPFGPADFGADPFAAPPSAPGGRDPFAVGDAFGDGFAGMPPSYHGGGPSDDRRTERDPFITDQPFGGQGNDAGGGDFDPFRTSQPFPRPAGQPPQPVGDDPFAGPPVDGLGGDVGQDPFGPVPGPAAEGPRPIDRGEDDDADPFGIGAGAEPSSYDPFAESNQSPPRFDAGDPFAGPPSPPPGRAPFGGDRGDAGPVIPDDFDPLAEDFDRSEWQGHSVPDHVPAEQQQFSVPKGARPGDAAGDQVIPDDWDLSQPPAAAPPAPPPETQPASPLLQAPPLRAAPPASQAASPPVADDPLGAFLAAAGIDPTDLSPDQRVQTMRLAGMMFREMIAGLCDILMVRASIKERFQMADRTTLRRSENNPLKFSVDADDALANLLTRPRAGFLPADQAVREALGDIKAHELAVLAGMQVALKALLDRFDPENLEKRIEQTSVWDSILPGNRKAKYWELFRDHYREIAREAEDDFHGLFGREFSRAYEQQVKRL